MITVHAFAQVKELIGATNQLELKEDTITIPTLKILLTTTFPSIAPIIDHCRFSSAVTIYPNDTILKDGSVIYIIPPSSGG